MWLLIHAGLKLNHVSKRGPRCSARLTRIYNWLSYWCVVPWWLPWQWFTWNLILVEVSINILLYWQLRYGVHHNSICLPWYCLIIFYECLLYLCWLNIVWDWAWDWTLVSYTLVRFWVKFITDGLCVPPVFLRFENIWIYKGICFSVYHYHPL